MICRCLSCSYCCSDYLQDSLTFKGIGMYLQARACMRVCLCVSNTGTFYNILGCCRAIDIKQSASTVWNWLSCNKRRECVCVWSALGWHRSLTSCCRTQSRFLLWTYCRRSAFTSWQVCFFYLQCCDCACEGRGGGGGRGALLILNRCLVFWHWQQLSSDFCA